MAGLTLSPASFYSSESGKVVFKNSMQKKPAARNAAAGERVLDIVVEKKLIRMRRSEGTRLNSSHIPLSRMPSSA